MRFHSVLAVGIGVALGMGATGAMASSFPAFGADSMPGFIIDVTGITGGVATSATVTATGQGPYDGIEDTYIGVENSTNSYLKSLSVFSTSCITCFDSDGIQLYSSPPPPIAFLPPGYSLTGYEGPDNYFSVLGGTSATVSFLGNGVIPSNITWFSLENNVTTISTSPIPLPAALPLFASAFAGFGVFSRFRKRKRLANSEV